MSETANTRTVRICPKCGREYTGHPALSRADNSTAICPDCGTREALESLGISIEEQSEIIGKIHELRDEKARV